jgi:hypothetical protein
MEVWWWCCWQKNWWIAPTEVEVCEAAEAAMRSLSAVGIFTTHALIGGNGQLGMRKWTFVYQEKEVKDVDVPADRHSQSGVKTCGFPARSSQDLLFGPVSTIREV